MQQLITQLNADNKEKRLEALKEIIHYRRTKSDMPVKRHNDANNHIHTIYSFSPYSPTLAAYKAFDAGLVTMGIMDHDSLSGAKEFIQACSILGTSCTVGVETRAHFPAEFNFGKINNPDQENLIYIAAHGVPHQNIDRLNSYFEHYRQRRNARNMLMTQRINNKFAKYGIELNFDTDVLPLSMSHQGGSVTERHLMYALSHKVFAEFKTGEAVTEFVKSKLGIAVSEKVQAQLCDVNNSFRLYDLLGVLKSDASFFYIPASDESPAIKDYIKVVKSCGAIVAYPYLGDVGSSVTGDKRPQKFEDDFLDELMEVVHNLGVEAVAYMPTRNTREQLLRLRGICARYGFFEISGEDINSPRQKFECAMLADKQFANLIDSTWALIGHEIASTEDITGGMFSPSVISSMPDLKERIKHFGAVAKSRVKA